MISIRGLITYNEDFDSCIQKRDEIIEELSKLFPNADKLESFIEHAADPSGNSIVDSVYFENDSGLETEAACYNFDENFRSKKNWAEGLQVSIDSREIVSWLSDY